MINKQKKKKANWVMIIVGTTIFIVLTALSIRLNILYQEYSVSKRLASLLEAHEKASIKQMLQHGTSPDITLARYPTDDFFEILKFKITGKSNFPLVTHQTFEEKYTGLAYAVMFNDFELAQIFLEHGASPNPKYSFYPHSPPLATAVGFNDYKMAELLLKYGADISSTYNGQTAMEYAHHWKNAKMIALLKQYGAKESGYFSRSNK